MRCEDTPVCRVAPVGDATAGHVVDQRSWAAADVFRGGADVEHAVERGAHGPTRRSHPWRYFFWSGWASQRSR